MCEDPSTEPIPNEPLNVSFYHKTAKMLKHISCNEFTNYENS